MTATLTAQETAIQTIEANVLRWCQQLCENLRQNYIDYSIRNHERYLLSDSDKVSQDYHAKAIEKLKNGECDYHYVITTGKKYHKIVMEIHYENYENRDPSRSVHAFVDKKTGEVYKPATWQSPAKGVRYDMRLIRDREWLFENADWSGSYLYKR